MTFVFKLPRGGAQVTGVRKTFACAKQDGAKREETVPVSLPSVGGTYYRLNGVLHRDGVALPPREGL